MVTLRLIKVTAPALVALCLWSPRVRADDLSHKAPVGREVAAIMDVLRVANADPSTACSSALDDMHTTDNQMRTLAGQMTDDNETEPVVQHQSGEFYIARDILASDLDTVAATCGPQARAACEAPASTTLAASCGKLRTASARPQR